MTADRAGARETQTVHDHSAAPESDIHSEEPRGRSGILRTLVRQLAAAMYVVLACSRLAPLIPDVPLAAMAVYVLIVGGASALLAKLVEGSTVSAGLVGLWVALLFFAIELTATPWDLIDPVWTGLSVLQIALLTGAGWLGAYWQVRRSRRRA